MRFEHSTIEIFRLVQNAELDNLPGALWRQGHFEGAHP
jgi:hypothetical protein